MLKSQSWLNITSSRVSTISISCSDFSPTYICLRISLCNHQILSTIYFKRNRNTCCRCVWVSIRRLSIIHIIPVEIINSRSLVIKRLLRLCFTCRIQQSNLTTGNRIRITCLRCCCIYIVYKSCYIRIGKICNRPVKSINLQSMTIPSINTSQCLGLRAYRNVYPAHSQLHSHRAVVVDYSVISALRINVIVFLASRHRPDGKHCYIHIQFSHSKKI